MIYLASKFTHLSFHWPIRFQTNLSPKYEVVFSLLCGIGGNLFYQNPNSNSPNCIFRLLFIFFSYYEKLLFYFWQKSMPI